MKVSRDVRTVLAVIVLLSTIGIGVCRTVAASGSQTITSGRPLAELALLLEHRYAKAVTYEDPFWVWPGELHAQGRANPLAKWALFPIDRTVTIPALLETSQGPNEIVTSAITQYNAQSDASQFKVTSWKLGLHIIPTKVHDESRALVDASNPLDAIVSVPETERSVTEHFEQLCAAVSAASGMSVELIPWGIRPGDLDRVFAAEPSSFTWGGNNMVARDALTELILRSATTLSWQLRCQASAHAEDRFCFLTIQPLAVDTTDAAGKPVLQALTFDRCGKCFRPAIPPPPPVPGKQ